MTPDQIKKRIRHMLIDGEIIEMDDGVQLRYFDAGQRFEHGDIEYEAMEDGVYIRPVNYHWIYVGSFRTVEEVYFDPIIKEDFTAFEALWISWSSSKVLRQLNQEKRERHVRN